MKLKYSKIFLFTSIILYAFSIQTILAQTEGSNVNFESRIPIEVGYVRLPKYKLGGFHLGMIGILDGNFGFEVNADMFSLPTGDGYSVGLFEANCNYYLQKDDNVKIFPYLGLSVGLLTGNNDTPDNPMDIEGTNFGIDTGISAIVSINLFFVSGTFGYNSILKRSSLYRISIGYAF